MDVFGYRLRATAVRRRAATPGWWLAAAGAQGGDGCRRYRLPARGAVGRRDHARGVARLVPRVRYSVAR